MELQQQQLKLDGTSLPLQVGMSLTANINFARCRICSCFLANFRTKQNRFNAFDGMRVLFVHQNFQANISIVQKLAQQGGHQIMLLEFSRWANARFRIPFIIFVKH